MKIFMKAVGYNKLIERVNEEGSKGIKEGCCVERNIEKGAD